MLIWVYKNLTWLTEVQGKIYVLQTGYKRVCEIAVSYFHLSDSSCNLGSFLHSNRSWGAWHAVPPWLPGSAARSPGHQDVWLEANVINTRNLMTNIKPVADTVALPHYAVLVPNPWTSVSLSPSHHPLDELFINSPQLWVWQLPTAVPAAKVPKVFLVSRAGSCTQLWLGCGETSRGGDGDPPLYGSKVCQGELRLGIRRLFFKERVAKHWNGLPREVVDAPSLLMFKRHLDKDLNTL